MRKIQGLNICIFNSIEKKLSKPRKTPIDSRHLYQLDHSNKVPSKSW